MQLSHTYCFPSRFLRGKRSKVGLCVNGWVAWKESVVLVESLRLLSPENSIWHSRLPYKRLGTTSPSALISPAEILIKSRLTSDPCPHGMVPGKLTVLLKPQGGLSSTTVVDLEMIRLTLRCSGLSRNVKVKTRVMSRVCYQRVVRRHMIYPHVIHS